MAEAIQIVTGDGESDALHWFLSSEELMWQALKELIRQYGCRGVVMEWPDSAGGEVWRLEVNDATGSATTAGVGEHLVLVPGGGLRTYDQDMYEAIALPEGD